VVDGVENFVEPAEFDAIRRRVCPGGRKTVAEVAGGMVSTIPPALVSG
jgi:hypothetical protein